MEAFSFRSSICHDAYLVRLLVWLVVKAMANMENAQSKGWDGSKPNLRELRESLKITQRQLSDKIGVTENTIANWEHGRSIGKWLYQIKLLCQALDCSFEELTDGLETPLSAKEEQPFSDIRKDYQSAKEETGDLD